jgi:hypothetical protein
VIKDVKLKYLGVTMYDIVRGVFHGSAFEFNDSITKSDKFYHVIIDSYIPFSIERWKRCADHGYKECRVCRHTGPKYILFQHGINSTLLNNYYYICDIKFNKDDNFYVDTEQDSHPYFRYDPSVENVRPLLNSEFVQLKYSEKPNYVTNDIFNNYIKPYIIPSKPENLDDLYYPSKFTMKNVRVRYIQKFDEKMTKHDFFIVDNIKTTLKFMRFVEIYNTHITEIFRSDD